MGEFVYTIGGNMYKKIISFLIIMFIAMPCFAHSGRLDGNGGHKVNKKWEYNGRYIVVKNNLKYYQTGKIFFDKGNYHYHCQPSVNGFKDGIYLPSANKDLSKVISPANISENNFVSSRKSNKYHKQNCKYIKNIKEENIIVFENKKDAEDNDYAPCKYCIG